MKLTYRLLVTFLTVISLTALSAAQKPVRSFELQGLSPQFWDLVDHDAKLATMATGFGFTEGPMWDPSGFLYVSDETINKIFRVHPDGTKESGDRVGRSRRKYL